MKWRHYPIVFLSLLGLMGIGLPPFTLAQQPAFVTVLSTPEHAPVYLDTTWIGFTPIHSLALAPGTYHLTVVPPAAGVWNWNRVQFQLRLDESADTTLIVRFPSQVWLNSIPPGAFVQSNGRVLGTTPLLLDYSLWKGKSLVLEKPGYQSRTVKLDSFQNVMVRLTARPLSKSPLTSLQRSTPARKTLYWKFAFLSASVLSHWMAFYFKNEADNNYEKYLHTADPEEIRHYWNRTRTYDRLTDIALGISYTSLAALIYLVIWH